MKTINNEKNKAQKSNDSHSLVLGYALWIFGFTGAHRFYFGKPISGSLWFCTFGLFGIGWLVDIFLIPSMEKEADQNYLEGNIDYNTAWILLSFFGFLGLHRFYMKKWISGIVYLLTGALFGLGWLFDFWTLNEQIDIENRNNIRSFNTGET